MVDSIQKEACCGCKACANICPLHCITFQMDQEGFEYPVIDKDKCTECGLCEKVCPFMNAENKEKSTNIEIYGAWCKDEEVRYSCSSGGLFTVFAQYVIKQGGVVFGAGVGDEGKILHFGTDRKEDISRFQKSKYVQSDMGQAYQKVKKYLEQKRLVLFSGTPCQIMGLHQFLLGKQYENLYTIDVICAGVSSPGVWNSYLRQMEAQYKSKISDIIFRHKDIDNVVLKGGDRNLTIKLIFENGKTVYQNRNENEFFDGFLNKLFPRPSCAQCKAKNFKSGSDIQLGDFWEIEKIYPEVLPLTEDKKRVPFGVSEVFIYTEKGKKLFEAIKESIVSFPADLILVKEVQKNTNWYLMTSGAQPHWNRKAFFEDYQKDPWHVNEIIAYYLDRQNMKRLSGKRAGVWGSFRLREILRIIEQYTAFEVCFQFRNSTIYSAVSNPDPAIEYMQFSSNFFRNEMMKNDITKEFCTHMGFYAQKTDLFVMDLLEERYTNAVCGKTVVTKSEAYYESIGLQGMPLTISFDMWKEAMQKFMQLLQKHFEASRIIVVENYLCSEYGETRQAKYAFKNKEYIKSINSILSERYQYIRERWPEIVMIPKAPEEFCYTETNQMFGCIPEHMNYTAYSYMAQQLHDAAIRTI